MSEDLVIVPSDGDGFVALARTRTGTLFRKHLLNYGPLRHPNTGATITIDDTFATTLKRNFDNRVCDIVQVPLANAKNEHTEDPERNIGEVIDVQIADNKVYAVLDVRDDTHASKLGKTYLGASAMMSLDYTDTKTGKKVGPTLLHTCVTNRPYVTGLDDYEQIVAATSDTSSRAVLLTTDVVDNAPNQETHMPDAPTTTETTPDKPSLQELLTTLKTDHDIDVPALQTQAGRVEASATLSRTLVDALSAAGVVKLSAEQDPTSVPTEDVVGAVAELAGNNVALTDRVNKLERREAATTVRALVEAGRVMPAQEPAFVELKLTNPAMFDQLVPAEPIVTMTAETGVTPPKDRNHVADVDAEIARLSGVLSGSK